MSENEKVEEQPNAGITAAGKLFLDNSTSELEASIINCTALLGNLQKLRHDTPETPLACHKLALASANAAQTLHISVVTTSRKATALYAAASEKVPGS
jgi:hypothetical protein